MLTKQDENASIPSSLYRRKDGSMKTWMKTLALGLTMAWMAHTAHATETENYGFRILPVPGKITIDGDYSDWDLSAGIFTCGQVEYLRDKYALWLHGMYDEENVYILARWLDITPLNNPELRGGFPWNGDCLQVRFRLFPGDTVNETTSYCNFWQDASGESAMDRQTPDYRNGNRINLDFPSNMFYEREGAFQAFKKDEDGKGYTQEIKIPWKSISATGKVPAVGERFMMTFEPNFTAGEFGRITIKDLFNDKGLPNRVFTWRAYDSWGFATLEAKGNVEPQPVRLADSRTFPVTMVDGKPVAD